MAKIGVKPTFLCSFGNKDLLPTIYRYLKD
jgi:hypothetical protein